MMRWCWLSEVVMNDLPPWHRNSLTLGTWSQLHTKDFWLLRDNGIKHGALFPWEDCINWLSNAQWSIIQSEHLEGGTKRVSSSRPAWKSQTKTKSYTPQCGCLTGNCWCMGDRQNHPWYIMCSLVRLHLNRFPNWELFAIFMCQQVPQQKSSWTRYTYPLWPQSFI